MTPEEWLGIKALFDAALELPEKDRKVFLEHAYAGEPKMQVPVEALLAAHAQAGSFLDDPIAGDNLKDWVETASSKPEAGSAGAEAVLPLGSAAEQRFTPGTVLVKRYRIVAALGRGGMGEVYRADDLVLGQTVALKFLPREFSSSPRAMDRFRAEVRNARQISHPNVCRVYDIGEADDLQFLTMEYVDGEDLASLLRRIGRLPADKALQVAHQICSGLAAAHARGVLHRDLKPSNIMIDGRGIARVTDFGLAVRAEESNQEMVGTPAYMAPEQFKGQPAAAHADIYALGLVLYEIYTGKRPFEAQGFVEWKQRHSEERPTPPSSQSGEIDPLVERAILRCLEKEPSRRPASVLSVAAALPGGDPLAAALAAGETPSPEIVAAAGPEGALHALAAWALLGAILGLIAVSVLVLSRYTTDWGLASMKKSPEVLADRAQELARKLGYPTVRDRDFWLDSNDDYINYVAREPTNWRRTVAAVQWPDPINFWYRQSPQWMTPATALTYGPPMVTATDPPYEVSGLVTLNLDLQGRLLYLRAVPPQANSPGSWPEMDWSVLFAEAGLDVKRFSAAEAKWTPLEPFDQHVDWEGSLAERPDVPLHVTAAAYHGLPVYFALLAPWDHPGRADMDDTSSSLSSNISTALFLIVMAGCFLVGGCLTHRNIRLGRGDHKGAFRLAIFVYLGYMAMGLSIMHYVPNPEYVLIQFYILAVPMLFALLIWIAYMAIEPFTRRRWPRLLVSWQRVLSGRLSDPLVGRDVLLGGLAGAVVGVVGLSFIALIGMTGRARATPVSVEFTFGRGLSPSIGSSVHLLASCCVDGFLYLLALSILVALLRRQWLGLLAMGILLVVLWGPSNLFIDLPLAILSAVLFLAVLMRIGLVAAVAYFLVERTLFFIPPLEIGRWYEGRAIIALIVPLAVLIYGFYVSLGGRPLLGRVLVEE